MFIIGKCKSIISVVKDVPFLEAVKYRRAFLLAEGGEMNAIEPGGHIGAQPDVRI